MIADLRNNNSVPTKVVSLFKNLGSVQLKLNTLLYFLILGHLIFILGHKFKMPVHCFNYTGHREQSFSLFQDAEDHKCRMLYIKKKKKGCPADKFPKQESESELLNEKTMCSDLNEIPVRNPSLFAIQINRSLRISLCYSRLPSLCPVAERHKIDLHFLFFSSLENIY